MESFCAYQERSQLEIRYKLIELGVFGNDLEHIISSLIENNFLNEARFAKAYTNGKLRIKNWGKIKIKQGLKLKGVSAPLIKSALQQIDEDEYYAILEKIIAKKSKEIKDKDPYIFKNKVFRYALSRGFETDLISFVLNNKLLNQ
jgi:regulatory protein